MTTWFGPFLILLITMGVIVLLWMVDQGTSHEELWVPVESTDNNHGTSMVLMSYSVAESNAAPADKVR